MKIEDLKKQQPKVFSEFQQIVQTGRLAHAYLFLGNFASLEMALFLAQALYCQDLKEGLPCQECRNCRLIEAGTFSDVKRLAPTNQVIKTDLVREVMQDFSQSGFETDHHVLIIEGADKLHVNAANSLLKFIEEPQSKVNIFLISNQEERILPTIKSRCQIVHFPKNEGLMREELEQAGVLKTQAQLLAALSSSTEQALNLNKGQQFPTLMSVAEQWVKSYLAQDGQDYLLTAKLCQLIDDKEGQALVLDLLTLLLARALPSTAAQDGLSQLLRAKDMWQANVSLQNALEYMVLEART
ncbi:DNA polymerase III subunit delta' [Streptococcus moroccensis]|uniref:DNA polymerase-3 subunit delta n=1 Tax=Streptococcus moroccensis TaxID=1451356 RepID=A0ABT9YQK6_9STRE|nr:DNA polymerase III subunit delta' [Streptococcus moroccensis]MDQ0222283.1 DNA polymerase-3 subunit delta' [Streptococcus moroccensis]